MRPRGGQVGCLIYHGAKRRRCPVASNAAAADKFGVWVRRRNECTKCQLDLSRDGQLVFSFTFTRGRHSPRTRGMNGLAPASNRNWHVVVLRIAIIAASIFIGYFAVRDYRSVRRQLRGDWGVYYQAGTATRRHAPLYTLEWGPDMTFKNAPCVALLVAPFSLLPAPTARVLWVFADFGLFLILLQLVARLQWPDDRDANLLAWPVVLAVWMSVKFLIDQWHAGQSTILFLMLTVGSFYCIQRGRMLPAGALLAAAVCVKLVPICFVPYFLFHRRGFVGLLSFVGSLLLLLALPALWHGWETNAALLAQWPRHLIATEIPNQVTRMHNQSVYAMLARLLTKSEYDCKIGRAS